MADFGLWMSPQNPHKPAPALGAPTKTPRTERHYPAQDGTAANMALLALTSLYAGSAGADAIDRPSVNRQVIRSSPIAELRLAPNPQWFGVFWFPGTGIIDRN